MPYKIDDGMMFDQVMSEAGCQRRAETLASIANRIAFNLALKPLHYIPPHISWPTLKMPTVLPAAPNKRAKKP